MFYTLAECAFQTFGFAFEFWKRSFSIEKPLCFALASSVNQIGLDVDLQWSFADILSGANNFLL